MLVRGQLVYFGGVKGGMAFVREVCPNVKEMSEGYNDAEFLVGGRGWIL